MHNQSIVCLVWADILVQVGCLDDDDGSTNEAGMASALRQLTQLCSWDVAGVKEAQGHLPVTQSIMILMTAIQVRLFQERKGLDFIFKNNLFLLERQLQREEEG